MGEEVNLLRNYPVSKRDVNSRANEKTEEDRRIARKFEFDFFDGDRRHGYGGYSYNEKFWAPVIPDFIKYYKLKENSSILDVGSGKGFMLYEFSKFLPNAKLRGIDISKYAYENSLPDIRQYLDIGSAHELPYEDNTFDLVVSIVTLHNLNREECGKALSEMCRVSKRNAFITLDSYSNEKEKKMMEAWNLTAKTMMHVNEWVKFFDDVGYDGDYYWFKPI